MSDQQHEELSEQLEGREKAESKVKTTDQQTNEAIENAD